ncbi:MAG: alpha/beta fold hydrolase [Chloroflexia bacterium]|nr:alpha/beta fold hydrolase [Chloroflexia bacterium]
MRRPPADRDAVPATGPVPVTMTPGAVVPYGWRFGRHLTRGRADVLLRSQVLRRLKGGWRARFAAMGLPADVVADTLAEVRALSGWAEAWTGTAQRFLGDARRAEREGDLAGDADLRQLAALCYHVAGWFAYEDQRLAKACRASATSLFARTVSQTLPRTRRILVPWRTTMLPGYLALPETAGPSPLVVLLNGVTTSKEELILWRGAFLREGLAVLALDNPGTGEVTGDRAPDPRDDDFTAGIFDLATHDRDLDADRVVLVGFSLGGAIAVHAAAAHHRIAGIVAVTPPFAPGDWFERAIPLLRDQCLVAGGDEDLAGIAAAYDLGPAMARLRCPALVFGAGQDLMVPPAEAIRLAAAGGDLATLVWYPRGTHGLYDALDDWTTDAARWIAALVGHTPSLPVPAVVTRHEAIGDAATPSTVPVIDGTPATWPVHGSPAAAGAAPPVHSAPPRDPGATDSLGRGGEGHDVPTPAGIPTGSGGARDASDDRGDTSETGDPHPGRRDPGLPRWAARPGWDGEDRIIDSRVVVSHPDASSTDSTEEHPIPRPEDFA